MADVSANTLFLQATQTPEAKASFTKHGKLS
jgi:hypothetical protein